MRYLLLIIFSSFISTAVIAQTNMTPRCSVFIDAQMDVKHWRQYLARTLEMDSLTIDTIPPGIYKVIAQFIINKAGCITDVKLINDPGHGLGARVIKSIYSYDGTCIPAVQNGRKVRAYRKQVITFVIEESNCVELSPVDFIL